MSMKKDLIDTIMEKEYVELTPAEQVELKEFCANEDEYNQMKDVFIGVESLQFEQPVPRKETKQRLDDLFDQTYPKAAPVWYSSVLTVIVPKEKPLFRQPLVQVAAVGLLFLLVYPFWTTQVNVPAEKKTALAVNEPQKESPVVTEPEVKPVANTTPGSDAKMVTAVEETRSPQIALNQPAVATVDTGIDDMDMDLSVAAIAESDPSDHPDGIFVAYSQPASETPELFDLLTTTF